MARAEGGKPRIVVVDNDTRPLVISSSQRDLKSWTLDGESGHFNVTEAHEKGVMSLGVASGLAGPMVVSGGADGTIRIWSVDSASLYADIPEAHKRGVWTLLATEDEQHRSIVVSGSLDGSLRSWTLDGQPAGIEARGRGHVMALAQADYHGQRLVVSAHDQALRSWWLDGRAGPFAVDEAHGRGVLALATVTRDGETLVVSGGHDGDVKSWRLDGSPGIFQLPRLHSRVISLLALEHTGPVLIVGGEEGTIRSWRPHGIALVRGPGWAEMDVPTANDVQLRRMSLASPLELELHLRELIIATPLAFGFLLYAIKRLAGFPLEVRLHRAELRVQLEAAARVCKQMEEAGDAAERVDALRHDSDNLWELTDVSLTDIDE
jgi:hypothetical protein